MKWQTAILNSVRRNDITSLEYSQFEELLEELIFKFKCHGDSAYINSTNR